MAFQPSHPPLCIFKLREAGVSIFPENEEFFVMLYGFRVSILFLRLVDYFVTGRPIFCSSSWKRG